MPTRQSRSRSSVDSPSGAAASLRWPTASEVRGSAYAEAHTAALWAAETRLDPSERLHGGLSVRCGLCDWGLDGSDAYVLREELIEHLQVDHDLAGVRPAARSSAAPRAVDEGPRPSQRPSR